MKRGQDITSPSQLIIESCPACGNAEISTTSVSETYFLRAFDAEITINFAACEDCGLLFHLDPLAPEWMPEYYENNNQLRRSVVSENEAAVIEKQAAFVDLETNLKGSHVLEVGPNTGSFLNYLHANFSCLTRFQEFNTEAKRILTDRGHFEDNETAGPYDLIVLRHVLEHIPCPLGTVTGWRPRLKDTGILFVEIPDWSFLDDNTDLVTFEHVNQFSQMALCRLLDRSGFVVVRLEQDITLGYTTCRNRVLRALARPKNVIALDDLPGALEAHQHKAVGQYHIGINRVIEEARLGGLTLGIYGASWWTERALRTTRLREADVVAIFDKDPRKQAKPFMDLPVMGPEKIDEVAPDCILVLNSFESEIKQELKDRGIRANIIGWSDLPGYGSE